MMKTILSIVIITITLFSASSMLYSQQWQIAEIAGGLGNDQAVCIATDSEGNIYVGGAYEWTATFQNQTIGSNGRGDFFLAKYDPSGVLKWVKHGGGGGMTIETSGDAVGSIIIDDQDRVFIAGTFDGTASFGNHTLTCYYGQVDAFLARYDTAGNCLWVRHMGGQYKTGSRAIVLNDTDHVYITGISMYTDSLHCLDTSIAMNDHYYFLAEFDLDGNFYGIRSITGDGQLIVCDGKSWHPHTYFCGYYKNMVAIDTIELPAVENWQPVIFRMDSLVGCNWAVTFESDDQAEIYSIEISESKYIYCCGMAMGRFVVGSDTLANGGGFIMKLNQNGNPLWIKKAAAKVRDVQLDSSGNLIISGVFKGEHHFSDCQATSTGNNPNMYIAKLDTNGNCLGVTTVANVFGAYQSMLDANDQFYITGYCKATEFGTISVGNYGEMDAFWAKLDYVSGLQEQTGGGEHALSIYANPNTGVFHVKVPPAVSHERDLMLRIFDNSNRLVHEQKLDMSEETPRINVSRARPGMYHLQLIAKDRVYTGKMIVE